MTHFWAIRATLAALGPNCNRTHYDVDLQGIVRYYFYFHQAMGYVLASFLIAGLSGLTK